MEKSLIVAVADNYAIGKDNALLWHLSEDLKFFKRTTMGCPVIMGFMTFKSLGSKPLPGRKNIVISIFPWPDAPTNITVVGSLEEGYEEAAKACAGTGAGKCFVIGGGLTYKEALQYSDSLYITHVHTTVGDADAFFPEIDPALWYAAEKAPEIHDEETGLDFQFVTYRRR